MLISHVGKFLDLMSKQTMIWDYKRHQQDYCVLHRIRSRVFAWIETNDEKKQTRKNDSGCVKWAIWQRGASGPRQIVAEMSAWSFNKQLIVPDCFRLIEPSYFGVHVLTKTEVRVCCVQNHMRSKTLKSRSKIRSQNAPMLMLNPKVWPQELNILQPGSWLRP